MYKEIVDFCGSKVYIKKDMYEVVNSDGDIEIKVEDFMPLIN